MTGWRAARGRSRGRHGVSLLLVGILALPAFALLIADDAEAATTRTLAITSATAHPTVPFGGFDGQATKVFDIDGDGDKEIIAQNDNQWVYVFDARTGGLLAEMKTIFPAGWGARSFNAPEVAIVAGDDKVHLVVANSAATVTSYVFQPVGSTATRFIFQKEWERRLTTCHSNPGMDSKPVLVDLDKDGRLEILAATEELGLYALRSDGAIYWSKCIGGGNAEPTVGDLNLDSWPDVVFGSDAGVVTAMNGRTGATMWAFSVHSRFQVASGSMPVGVAVGQLDGLGGLDVVAGARDSHNATDFEQNHAVLVALSSTGQYLWGKQDTAAGNPLTYSHPIIVDAANDGEAEVYWADWNTMGHKPGNWEVTGPANFYRYDKAGTMVWRTSLSTFWSNKDTPLADIDGDGVQEMLANGPGSNGHDGIWYLDTRTGAKEAFVDLYPYKLNRAPVVTDLFGDGRMQWVAQVSAYAAGGAHGLLIYDTGAPYSSAWPHLPYPPDGSAPPTSSSSTTSSTSSSSTTTPPGAFDATFTAVRGNEWWVQAQVSGNLEVTAVHASLNGGPWLAVAKQSWGWGSSHHIVQGTTVQLRATAITGQTDLSACYRWIPASNADATVVPCGGGTSSSSSSSTSGGTFTASFQPRAVGNDWWIEVAVTANQPVTKVETRVNSGAWVDLPRTDWGTWAKSVNAPNGSQVTFRASNAGGATVTSAPVTWT